MKVAGRKKTASVAPNDASVAAAAAGVDSAPAAADVAMDDAVEFVANGNGNLSAAAAAAADMAVDDAVGNGSGIDLPVGFGTKEKGKGVKEPSEGEEEEEEDEDEEGEEEDAAMAEGRPGPIASDSEMYPVQAIRRKKVKKGSGKVQYLVKWLGWPESANTWEPPENLELVPDIVEAFEKSLESGKQRKRRRNSGAYQTQPKKRQERSLTPYSLRRFTNNTTSDNHTQSAALNDLNLTDPRAFPRPVIFADEQENNGDASSLGKAKFSNGSSSTIPHEPSEINAENEYDPKLSELKAATTNGHGADKLAVQSQEGIVATDGDQMDGRSKDVSVEQVRSYQTRGLRKLKYGSAKKSKKDSYAGEPVNTEKPIGTSTGILEPARPGNAVHVGNNSQRKKPVFDIIRIMKPLGFSPTASGSDVVVSFMALRSDGMEVLVDNAFLKKHYPALLIQFYEQHIRYNACSD
ncbi:hypothetical protein RIF29_00489 [Crotalaria pallida]|uniref:Chromo domain-containing protein n=1 Tax=Crotalaria pallida TaxID=3830 RepID=A0AAN9P6J3_CROPI